ncbi:hypothetical protein, partial [Enterobacter intestinihominis]
PPPPRFFFFYGKLIFINLFVFVGLFFFLYINGSLKNKIQCQEGFLKFVVIFCYPGGGVARGGYKIWGGGMGGVGRVG